MADQFVQPFIPNLAPYIQDRRNFEEDQRTFNAELEARRQQFAENQKMQKIQEAQKLQNNYLTIASGLSDKKSLTKLLDIYNRNPLISETGLNLSPEDFEDTSFIPPEPQPPPKDYLATEKAIVLAQNPQLATQYGKGNAAIDQEVDAQAARIKLNQGRQFEPERNKLAMKRLDGILTENKTIESTQLYINDAIDSVKNLDDTSTGILGPARDLIGRVFTSVGLPIPEYNDIGRLKKQLKTIALKSIKSTLGGTGSVSDFEGKKLDESIATIEDDRSVMANSLKSIKFSNEYKYDTNTLEAILLEQNPESFSKIQLDVQKAYDFPMRLKSEENGMTTFTSFFDYKRRAREANPSITHSQVVSDWIDICNASLNSKYKVPNVSPELRQLMDSKL